MLTHVGPETGARFEYEAYDVVHLYTLAHYLEAGLVQPPIFLQTIVGVMGGIGPQDVISGLIATFLLPLSSKLYSCSFTSSSPDLAA